MCNAVFSRKWTLDRHKANSCPGPARFDVNAAFIEQTKQLATQEAIIDKLTRALHTPTVHTHITNNGHQFNNTIQIVAGDRFVRGSVTTVGPSDPVAFGEEDLSRALSVTELQRIATEATSTPEFQMLLSVLMWANPSFPKNMTLKSPNIKQPHRMQVSEGGGRWVERPTKSVAPRMMKRILDHIEPLQYRVSEGEPDLSLLHKVSNHVGRMAQVEKDGAYDDRTYHAVGVQARRARLEAAQRCIANRRASPDELGDGTAIVST